MTGNLWIREMAAAEDALAALNPAERLRIMSEAMRHVLFRSPSPLSPIISSEANRLINIALDASRADAPAVPEALVDDIGALMEREAAVASVMLAAAMDLTAGVAEGPRSNEAVDVLFSCYDAMMQSQGLGRIVTLQSQEQNAACWDVIHSQKGLLRMS